MNGDVARISHILDEKTRPMAVELDVLNRDDSLSPGMYPSVRWPIRAARALLLVPKSGVVTTTERTLVIRDRSGRAEWVDVRKGVADGDLIEVTGDLKAGDRVVRRASDEIREGDTIRTSAKKPWKQNRDQTGSDISRGFYLVHDRDQLGPRHRRDCGPPDERKSESPRKRRSLCATDRPKRCSRRSP